MEPQVAASFEVKNCDLKMASRSWASFWKSSLCRITTRSSTTWSARTGTGRSILTTWWWAPRGEAPTGPDHQVFYDGKRILVDGHAPASDPLVQAVAGAKSVQAILETRTGRRFDVKPVVG